MTLLTPALKVGIVVRRHPETEDVFEWHDIDVSDRRHATLEEIAEDLDLEIETLVDELSGAMLDEPEAADGQGADEDDDDLDGEAFEVSEVDMASDAAFNSDEDDDAASGAAVRDDDVADAAFAEAG